MDKREVIVRELEGLLKQEASIAPVRGKKVTFILDKHGGLIDVKLEELSPEERVKAEEMAKEAEK